MCECVHARITHTLSPRSFDPCFLRPVISFLGLSFLCLLWFRGDFFGGYRWRAVSFLLSDCAVGGRNALRRSCRTAVGHRLDHGHSGFCLRGLLFCIGRSSHRCHHRLHFWRRTGNNVLGPFDLFPWSPSATLGRSRFGPRSSASRCATLRLGIPLKK